MVCEGGIHVVYSEGEVDFVIAEIVWAVHIAKPGEFELMSRATVTEVDEFKTAVSGFFFTDYSETESVLIELDRFFKVTYI